MKVSCILKSFWTFVFEVYGCCCDEGCFEKEEEDGAKKEGKLCSDLFTETNP